MTDEVRRYYVQNVMPRVNTMLLAVVGIGVLTLSLKYVRLVTGSPDVLLNGEFWKRVVLLVLVIAFAAYNALAYYAYADVKEEHVPRVTRPARVFSLFLLDLSQITFAACMFGTMYIEDPVEILNAAACQATPSAAPCLSIGWHSIVMVFTLGVLWHVAVVGWYVTAESWRDRNVLVHVLLASAYAVLVLGNSQLRAAGDWLAIVLFGVIIGSIYVIQGSHWLRRSERQAADET